jgi:alpha-L-fucosidase
MAKSPIVIHLASAIRSSDMRMGIHRVAKEKWFRHRKKLFIAKKMLPGWVN